MFLLPRLTGHNDYLTSLRTGVKSVRRGRPKLFGQKCRVDKLLPRFLHRLRHQKMTADPGQGRTVNEFDAEGVWRGVWPGRAWPARVIGVGVSGLKLKPWYLIPTDLTLDPVEAVRVL